MAPRPKPSARSATDLRPSSKGPGTRTPFRHRCELELARRLECPRRRRAKGPLSAAATSKSLSASTNSKNGPSHRVVEPSFPSGVECLLDLVREAPESRGVRRVENLGAPVRRDREDGPRLREIVRAREAALQDPGAVRTKLSLGVPPALRVHLAAPCDDNPHPQKPVEIDLLFHRRPFPSHHARTASETDGLGAGFERLAASLVTSSEPSCRGQRDYDVCSLRTRKSTQFRPRAPVRSCARPVALLSSILRTTDAALPDLTGLAQCGATNSDNWTRW